MANLTGLTTNFFPTASETYANNLSSSISALAATVPVNSANEYTDGDVATITVDAGTSAEATFTGVKASTPARFINCIWTEGNLGVGHASGATVIDYDSATHMSQVSKGILQQHKQSGAHSNITADSILVNGSIIATGDVTEAGTTARVFRDEVLNDFVVSGGIWTVAAGLNGAMTAVSAFITGYRNSIVAVASRAFTASKDTYVDILRTTVGATTTFTLVYTEVANGAAAPALAANSIRIAKVVTSGVAITGIVQYGKDSLGNFIYYTSAFDDLRKGTALSNDSGGWSPGGGVQIVPNTSQVMVTKGGRIMCYFGATKVYLTGGTVLYNVYVDGNNYGEICRTSNSNGAVSGIIYVDALTPGSHTFDIRANNSGGSYQHIQFNNHSAAFWEVAM